MAIVFFAFFTQAATGFGAMVIAMTLSALIYPVDVLLTWFIPLVVLLSTYLLVRHHGHIDWALFLRRILPAMGAGLVLGQLVPNSRPLPRQQAAKARRQRVPRPHHQRPRHLRPDARSACRRPHSRCLPRRG